MTTTSVNDNMICIRSSTFREGERGIFTTPQSVSKALDHKPLSKTRSTQSWGTYLSLFKPRLDQNFGLYTILFSNSRDLSNYKHSECLKSAWLALSFLSFRWHWLSAHYLQDARRHKMRDDTRRTRISFSLISISTFQGPILTITHWSGQPRKELRRSGQTHFSCRLFVVQVKEPSSGQVSKFKSCI